MKKLLVLLSLVIVLVLQSCTSDPVGSENPKDEGKILLKIDRQNAPANVVFVKAYLTRDNIPTITGTLNLQSDSTADLLLQNIIAGDWHLKVDAEDDSGLILYTGETDVQIFAGFTSQVYLTLQPTGTGIGSIYINVTWGVPANYSWIDYLNNPVLSPSNTIYDYQGTSQARILYNGEKYMMWYVGLANGLANTMYAESQDGINWIRPVNVPVLYPGINGAWDSWCAAAGPVIKENGIYKMYYTGYSDPYGQYSIGLATSIDGIVWEKYPAPVINGTTGWEKQIAPHSILKIDSLYFLYFDGRSQTGDNRIGIAFSSDGITWTKYTGNPILTPTVSWEGTGVGWPSIIYENGEFKMVYMKVTYSSDELFGMATSIDGINWIKLNSNPIFGPQNTSNGWADYDIAYPCYVKAGNEYRIYYSGWNQGMYKIGFTRLM